MSLLLDRRTFLAAPFFVRNLISAPPSDQFRLGAFGASGMAYVTFDVLLRHPKVKLICVAEVDSSKLQQQKQRAPDARVYEDWRQMLVKEHSNLDAVCVGTPDHMHAPMAMSAMRFGLPVYQQKPMAHSIHEVHMLTAMAQQEESGHPDGHPDPFRARVQDRGPTDPGRRHRQDQGSPLVQREEMGRFRSASGAHRPRAVHPQLGSLDRCGTAASLHSATSTIP